MTSLSKLLAWVDPAAWYHDHPVAAWSITAGVIVLILLIVILCVRHRRKKKAKALEKKVEVFVEGLPGGKDEKEPEPEHVEIAHEEHSLTEECAEETPHEIVLEGPVEEPKEEIIVEVVKKEPKEEEPEMATPTAPKKRKTHGMYKYTLSDLLEIAGMLGCTSKKDKEHAVTVIRSALKDGRPTKAQVMKVLAALEVKYDKDSKKEDLIALLLKELNR